MLQLALALLVIGALACWVGSLALLRHLARDRRPVPPEVSSGAVVAALVVCVVLLARVLGT